MKKTLIGGFIALIGSIMMQHFLLHIAKVEFEEPQLRRS